MKEICTHQQRKEVKRVIQAHVQSLFLRSFKVYSFPSPSLTLINPPPPLFFFGQAVNLAAVAWWLRPCAGNDQRSVQRSLFAARLQMQMNAANKKLNHHQTIADCFQIAFWEMHSSCGFHTQCLAAHNQTHSNVTDQHSDCANWNLKASGTKMFSPRQQIHHIHMQISVYRDFFPSVTTQYYRNTWLLD